jgi:hypothetical protein
MIAKCRDPPTCPWRFRRASSNSDERFLSQDGGLDHDHRGGVVTSRERAVGQAIIGIKSQTGANFVQTCMQFCTRVECKLKSANHVGESEKTRDVYLLAKIHERHHTKIHEDTRPLT